MNKDKCDLLRIILPLIYISIGLLQVPIYGTNDDTIISFMVSGFFIDKSEMIIVSHFVIGFFFKFLYDSFNDINWYPIIYYGIQVYTLIVIQNILANEMNLSVKNRVILSMFLFCIFFPLMMNIQYTSTAYLCGMTGLFLLLTQFKNTNNELIIQAFILFSLSTLIRWEVPVSLLILFSPIFIYELLKTKSIKSIYLLVFLGVIILMIRVSDIYYYKHKLNGFNYQNYQSKLEIIMDHPLNLEDKNSILKEVDWSENDFNLLKKWFWIDNEIYKASKINALYLKLQGHRTLIEAFKHLYFALVLMSKYFGFVLISIFCFMSIFKLNNLYFVFFSFLITSVTIIGLCFFAKLPFRVFYPIVISFMFIQFYHSSQRKSKIVNKKYIISLIMAMSIFTIYSIKNQVALIKEKRKEFKDTFTYMKEQNDKIFIIRGGGQIPFEFSPLRESPKTYSKGNVLTTGWSINSNTYNQFLKRRGIENLSNSIISDSNIVIVDPPIEELKIFIKEHFALDIEYAKIRIPENLSYINSLNNSYHIRILHPTLHIRNRGKN